MMTVQTMSPHPSPRCTIRHPENEVGGNCAPIPTSESLMSALIPRSRMRRQVSLAAGS
jgi:hypothetical protein